MTVVVIIFDRQYVNYSYPKPFDFETHIKHLRAAVYKTQNHGQTKAFHTKSAIQS